MSKFWFTRWKGKVLNRCYVNTLYSILHCAVCVKIRIFWTYCCCNGLGRVVHKCRLRPYSFDVVFATLCYVALLILHTYFLFCCPQKSCRCVGPELLIMACLGNSFG